MNCCFVFFSLSLQADKMELKIHHRKCHPGLDPGSSAAVLRGTAG